MVEIVIYLKQIKSISQVMLLCNFINNLFTYPYLIYTFKWIAIIIKCIAFLLYTVNSIDISYPQNSQHNTSVNVNNSLVRPYCKGANRRSKAVDNIYQEYFWTCFAVRSIHP